MRFTDCAKGGADERFRGGGQGSTIWEVVTWWIKVGKFGSGSGSRAGVAVPNRFEPIVVRVHRNQCSGDLPALLSARMTIPMVYIRHQVAASIAKRHRAL
jgi:hypothetical protein